MATLSDYRLIEVIYESSNSLIYRASRRTDGQPFVLKMLKGDYPSTDKITKFKREYEILRNLDIPGVVRAYSLHQASNHWMIILEDFGGDSLELLKVSGKLDLPNFLNLAMAIADVLGQLHHQHIIHKDINPSNIILNPITQQVKLIDLGIATVISRENTTFRNPNTLEGTLSYMSPEQTGRMNRSIDYRTDLYSLGVTFYELLTGQLPFSTQDTLKLVHCHIAQQPLPPDEILSSIPMPISKIVMKLMAKNAEDRYQSAYALKADLLECLQQGEAKGQLELFPLGQHDISDIFRLPQKLYGREREIEILLAGFERVSQGTSELILVSGHAGVGKSTLVQELYKPITRQQGYFIAGKFDQLQRNAPYAPLIEAFQSLIRHLLTESEAEIAVWRERLQAALGSNGQLIVEVIPEVALIIGPQPKMAQLSPTEAQNRFNLVFQNFVKVFTQPEHPLVIFVDDLQRADSASLKLLQLFMSAADSRYLYLIGAYRDNEVDNTHPLKFALDEIRNAGRAVNQISLSPLDLLNVAQFTADTLHRPLEQVNPLADLVLAKTGGNPFFMNEFLKSLYSEGLLAFDVEQSVWRWNLAQIQTRNMTDNVVELMANKVQLLPEETQTVLRFAACIGNQFDLQTLSMVYEKPFNATASKLWDAVNEELIIPLNESYKLIPLEPESIHEPDRAVYLFAHDRIRQAVYSLIREEDKSVIHRRIGKALLQKSASESSGARVFDIANQLNAGRVLIGSQLERDELVQLNLSAGRKAKDSVAYRSAFDYLQVGLELLGKDSWQRQYELTLAVHIEACEVAYLSGEYTEMSRLTEIVLHQAQTPLDRVNIFEVRIQFYIAQNELREAVKTAIEMLRLLTIVIPENPGQMDTMLAMQEVQAMLAGKQIEDLLNLQPMVDPVYLAAMNIIATVPSASFAVQGLFVLMVCKQVALSIQFGYTAASPIAFATYGLILAANGDIDAGYRFGELALQITDRLGPQKFAARAYTLVHFFLRHGKQHLKESLPFFLQAYQNGWETGDLEFAAGALNSYCVNAYLAGVELTQLERELASHSQVMKQLKTLTNLGWLEPFRQAVLNWRGLSENPCRLIGEACDEESKLPIHLEMQDTSALHNIYYNKLILCYRFEAFSEAIEQATKVEMYFANAAGSPLEPPYYFYNSLARLAIFSECSESEQASILEIVAAGQKKLEFWANQAPMNYLHKFYLVEAERARVLGDFGAARDYYEQAIDLAQENHYLNEESLAYELAAKFYLAREQTRLARHYMRDAYYAYQRWGAAAKVKHLEDCYPQLLLQPKIGIEQPTASTLDLTSILKAAQTIAGEIVLETLLTRLMTIVIENAGAELGYLILEHLAQPNKESPRWVVEVEGRVNRDNITTLPSAPVEQTNLPIAIINYVLRTQKTVVLNDAANESAFTQDSYIVSHQPKSILCMPLTNQGKVMGVVYLENNLTTGAFTSDRVEVLSMLASQAAISLENARLYSNLATSEEKYRSLFENAPIGMFEIDLSQDPPLILAANRQAEMMYGWSAAEFTEISSTLLVPDDATADLQQMVTTLQRGETVTLETNNRRRNGTPFQVRISAILEKPEAHRMIITVEDITEEKDRQLEAEAIESERLRIAHEIHDGLAQDLIGLGYKVTLWHDLVDSSPTRMHGELDQLVNMLNGSLREVRRSIFALRPIALDELGFFEAIRQFVRSFGTQYDLDIEFQVVGSEERLPSTLELPLFRIIQESLNNVRKHAQATSVQIELNQRHPQTIYLSIRDNGVGFGPTRLEQATNRGHVGLKQLSERVQRLNGTFSIHSKEGQGTAITVTLPLAS